MMYFLNEKGHLYERGCISYRDYTMMRSKFSEVELEVLSSYLREKDYEVFSVGTRYPSPWPKELMIVYERLQDYKRASEFLGVLQFNINVEDDRKWFSTKSKLPNRELSTMFYAPLKLKRI